MKTVIHLPLKLLFCAVLLPISQLVIAHHSTIGQISSDITEITGTIKEFQFQNPHSWIQVYVTNDEGQIEEWSVEWGNPSNLLRQGYNPSTFAEGSNVVMRLQQHVSGAPLGEFVAAKLSNGLTIGEWESGQ